MTVIRVQSALVCDDVRKEDNGKLILIGVYGADIRVPETPANLILALVVRLEAQSPIETDVEFQCVVNGVRLGGAQGKLHLDKPGSALVSIPGLYISGIAHNTSLEFQWRSGNADWDTICSIPLIKQSTSSEKPQL